METSIEWMVLRLQNKLDELSNRVKRLEEFWEEKEVTEKSENTTEIESSVEKPLEDELINTKKVLQILGMSYNTLQGIINKGKLKALRISPRKIRFKRSDLNAYIVSLSD